MQLPDHLTDLIRGLLESDKSDPGMVYLTAAALADELRDWVGNPAGYVPREVLAGELANMADHVERVSDRHDQYTTDMVADARDALAGQCPAWFVLADFGRMTNLDIIKARLWVRRNAGRLGMYAGMGVALSDEPRDYGLPDAILDQPADVTNWELSPEAIAQMQEFEQQARPAEFQITGHWPPADDVQASREAFVRGQLDVPEGWRFEWIPSPTRGEPPYVYGHGHDDGDSWFLMLAEMTFTLEPGMPGSTPWPETYRTHVGRCERCRTVYATRPEVVEPEPGPTRYPVESGRFISLTRSEVASLRERFRRSQDGRPVRYGMPDRMFGLPVRVRDDGEPIDPRAANATDPRMEHRVHRLLTDYGIPPVAPTS